MGIGAAARPKRRAANRRGKEGTTRCRLTGLRPTSQDSSPPVLAWRDSALQDQAYRSHVDGGR